MQNTPTALDSLLSSVRAANMQLVQLATIRRTGRGEPGEINMRVRQYVEKLEAALLGGIPLVMEMESDIIRCGETKVIGEDLLSAHLCRSLYDEGVRALFIEPGVSTPELEKLAWLLSADWSSRAVFEADLQASAWQNRFAAIHIDAIAARVEIEDDDAEDLVEQLLHQLGGSAITDGSVMAPLLKNLQAIEASGPLRSAYADESSCAVEHPQAFERFCRRLEAVRDDVDVSDERISQVVFETLRNENTPAAVHALGDAMVEHVVRSLAAGQPGEASALLHWPALLLESDVEPSWLQSDALSRALWTLNDEAFWEAIISGVGRTPDPQRWRGPLFTLTLAMSAGAVHDIIASAAALPDVEMRSAVADGVSLLAERADIKPATLLGEATGDALKVALLAVARSQDATLIEPLLRHIASKDADIREAALIALRRQQSARIKVVVRQVLGDSAESVRTEAMRYIAVYQDRVGAEHVLEQLTAYQTGTRSAEELRAMSRVVLHVLGGEAIGALRTLALESKAITDVGFSDAILHVLYGAGGAGQRVLEEVGMIRPELRARIRALRGREG
ncbi:MAG: hypothetical protein P8R54_00415 [Myxococcota bacterium]|nr:hypothetical protein [Myxococcota bacterium]